MGNISANFFFGTTIPTIVDNGDEPTTAPETHGLGDRELVQFLTEEIVERKTQNVIVEGDEVMLIKKGKDETISINWNVNDIVDDEWLVYSELEQELVEMRSEVQFEVFVERGETTLAIGCSSIQDEPRQQDGEEFIDVFGIDLIALHEGEWDEDKAYVVDRDALDGYVYDLLMNLLEDKGINNEFVRNLSDLSTSYINMRLCEFTIGERGDVDETR